MCQWCSSASCGQNLYHKTFSPVFTDKRKCWKMDHNFFFLHFHTLVYCTYFVCYWLLDFTWIRGDDGAHEKVSLWTDLQLPLSAREHRCTRTGVHPQLLLQRRWPEAVEHHQQVRRLQSNITKNMAELNIKNNYFWGLFSLCSPALWSQ